MRQHVQGIHHITAIAGDPQRNVDFYAGMLGLRMVKKTVNFDDPGTYHFYYGDQQGTPGTILTFFPWPGSHAARGRAGNGQLTVISFSIPDGAMGYWIERLKTRDVEFSGPFPRFEEEAISFRDPDGIEVELVSSASDSREGWENGSIPADYAIRGFYSILLAEEHSEPTARMMTEMLGFRQIRENGSRLRYESGQGEPGTIVDLRSQLNRSYGRMGVGAVHHVAWRTPDDDTQQEIRQALVQHGVGVSPVMDRNYFHSIYFREPGQVLFEVATDPPGFAVDESREALGAKLMLPSWLEGNRDRLEHILPPITLPNGGEL